MRGDLTELFGAVGVHAVDVDCHRHIDCRIAGPNIQLAGGSRLIGIKHRPAVLVGGQCKALYGFFKRSNTAIQFINVQFGFAVTGNFDAVIIPHGATRLIRGFFIRQSGLGGLADGSGHIAAVFYRFLGSSHFLAEPGIDSVLKRFGFCRFSPFGRRDFILGLFDPGFFFFGDILQRHRQRISLQRQRRLIKFALGLR